MRAWKRKFDGFQGDQPIQDAGPPDDRRAMHA